MTCGESLAAELRRAGFRVTPQRAVILETVAHTGGHMSIQEVYAKALEKLPGLNIATIYRTIESLRKAGIIDLLSASSKPVHFSLRDPARPHGHLVCRICEAILEIDPAHINRLARNLEDKTGFMLDTDHLALIGLCRNCAQSDSGKDTI